MVFLAALAIQIGATSTIALGEEALPPLEEEGVWPEAPSNTPGFPLLSASMDSAVPLQPQASDAPPIYGIGIHEILDLAIRQSPSLSVQRAKVGESQMRALATGLLPNPEIGAGVKRSHTEGSGPILNVKQELPINGALGLERQAAHLRYSADSTNLRREIQVILGEVQTGYVEVLTRRELSGVEQHGMEVATESLRLVSDTLKAGLISTLPYTLAQTEYANAKNARQLAEREFRLARQGLARLLGIEESALPVIAGDLRQSLLPPDLDPNRQSRPDLQAASLRVQAAQTSVAAANRARIPNPVLGYSREETDEAKEDFFTVGLEVPLFNRKVARVQERIAEHQTASAERTALGKSVKAEIGLATNQLEARQQAVQIYETEIRPSTQRALEAAKSAFRSGTTDLSLILQTQSRLIEQERSTVRVLGDLRKAEIEYLLALGAPAKP
jgi:outer membrane protein TolC